MLWQQQIPAGLIRESSCDSLSRIYRAAQIFRLKHRFEGPKLSTTKLSRCRPIPGRWATMSPGFQAIRMQEHTCRLWRLSLFLMRSSSAFSRSAFARLGSATVAVALTLLTLTCFFWASAVSCLWNLLLRLAGRSCIFFTSCPCPFSAISRSAEKFYAWMQISQSHCNGKREITRLEGSAMYSPCRNSKSCPQIPFRVPGQGTVMIQITKPGQGRVILQIRLQKRNSPVWSGQVQYVSQRGTDWLMCCQAPQCPGLRLQVAFALSHLTRLQIYNILDL